MRTSIVKRARLTPGETIYEVRPWTRPLVISICSDCGYPAVAVSPDAANAAVWEHVAAIHLQPGVSRAMLNGE